MSSFTYSHCFPLYKCFRFRLTFLSLTRTALPFLDCWLHEPHKALLSSFVTLSRSTKHFIIFFFFFFCRVPYSAAVFFYGQGDRRMAKRKHNNKSARHMLLHIKGIKRKRMMPSVSAVTVLLCQTPLHKLTVHVLYYYFFMLYISPFYHVWRWLSYYVLLCHLLIYSASFSPLSPFYSP